MTARPAGPVPRHNVEHFVETPSYDHPLDQTLCDKSDTLGLRQRRKMTISA
jgi:hypothetical protein